MTDKIVKNPLIDPIVLEAEDGFELSLRPRNLDEYIGQEKIKSNLSVFIKAAKGRRESLDHVLLYGPPGLGKTTLAYIMAREMSADIKVTSGPVIERPGDLAATCTTMTFSLLTKFTDCRMSSRRFSIPPWKTSTSIS